MLFRTCEVRGLDYPEKELVRKSKNGDLEAFERLIMAYEKKIFNIAYRMTGNSEDAADIAQEVCIKIYKSIGNFKENSSFGTWVYRITSNVCIDEIRKRKNSTVSLNVKNEDDEEFERAIENKDRLPDEIVEGREALNAIKKCILELTPEQRMVIILRDVRGHSYEEISSMLNINIGTLKSRLNRARSLLKDKLRNMEHFKAENV